MTYTLRRLTEKFIADPHSSHARVSYSIRVKHERLYARIVRQYGDIPIKRISSIELHAWYERWRMDGKIAMAQSLMSRLRVLFRFGAITLENSACFRVLRRLDGMNVRKPPQRFGRLSKDQANAIRDEAHTRGWHSIALAQALQFELLLSQKDVIGEWVPKDSEGASNFFHHEMKWIGGLQWSDIEGDILKYSAGKRGREIIVDLRTAPMICDEFERAGGRHHKGPMVLNEATMAPWSSSEFRRKWRILARSAGLPDAIRNMHSKPAGTIAGGADRADISQFVSIDDIYRALRTGRELIERQTSPNGKVD